MSKSLEVKIGTLSVGGIHPVSVQSMTNVRTDDIQASVEQCMRILEAGGEMVRLTTQGIKEVESLAKIKDELKQRGILVPLVADIHFKASLAEEAAKVVEKIRINPGNYATRNTGRTEPYSPIEYAKELSATKEALLPLIEVCKKYQTVIRIGVNHGSLSERIMSRFGDTPDGMAEAAMEFIRIFASEGFQNLVVSMKASNPRIMVYANRALIKKMQSENMVFPVHLGVTEAGEGEDGRIKSAMGIGSLLNEGIGDTIRVSLTEDPEMEIPVGKKIIHFSAPVKKDLPLPGTNGLAWNQFSYEKRLSLPSENIGGRHVPVVIVKTGNSGGKQFPLAEAGYSITEDGKVLAETGAADFIFPEDDDCYSAQGKIHTICNYSSLKVRDKSSNHHYPFIEIKDYPQVMNEIPGLHFLHVNLNDFQAVDLKILDSDFLGCLVISLPQEDAITKTRQFFCQLAKGNCRMPVILHKIYHSESLEDLIIHASCEFGPVFMDGLGDGIWIEDYNLHPEPSVLRNLSFGILQSSGMRISKTEFISCPGCGRTLFNLQLVSQKIRNATSHLAGLKIAIMGCIVNGPGEMADADYGYVGSGPGVISLYRGRQLMKQSIPEDQALDQLIELIKADGKWKERKI